MTAGDGTERIEWMRLRDEVHAIRMPYAGEFKLGCSRLEVRLLSHAGNARAKSGSDEPRSRVGTRLLLGRVSLHLTSHSRPSTLYHYHFFLTIHKTKRAPSPISTLMTYLSGTRAHLHTSVADTCEDCHRSSNYIYVGTRTITSRVLSRHQNPTASYSIVSLPMTGVIKRHAYSSATVD